MKIKNVLLTISICMTVTLTVAQNQLPPVFADDTTNIRPDELSQAYIAPRRIVWISNEKTLKSYYG